VSVAAGACAPDDARAHIEAFMAASNASDLVAIDRTLSPALMVFFETLPDGQTRAVTHVLAGGAPVALLGPSLDHFWGSGSPVGPGRARRRERGSFSPSLKGSRSICGRSDSAATGQA